jgi:NTE family protein
MQRPDILVLGAGGTIGAAWMSGVLAGLVEATGIDLLAIEHFVGTSAGAMVAADILGGVEPRAPDASDLATPIDPAHDPLDAETAESGADGALPREEQEAAAAGFAGGLLSGAGRLGGTLATAAGTPLAPLALAAARSGGARARAAALARILPPEPTLDELGARIAGHGLAFDGRLRIVCVERESGRRVVFGAPGAPPATVAEAVQASCSIPWVYRPVRIGERDYVDGAIWSPTNLDAAPALRGTHVLCLAPTSGPLSTALRHPAVRAAASTAATLETFALRNRGAIVQFVAPPPRPSDEHVRISGYRQGLALGRGPSG